jgi:hypothetical protein
MSRPAAPRLAGLVIRGTQARRRFTNTVRGFLVQRSSPTETSRSDIVFDQGFRHRALIVDERPDFTVDLLSREISPFKSVFIRSP